MDDILKKSISTVKDIFGKLYNPVELDNLIVDSLDLFIYRFVRKDLTTKRHSAMTGTDIAEYVGILKDAEEVVKIIDVVTKTIEDKPVKIKNELDIYAPLKGLFQYLFTNYNLDQEEFKIGLESLMQESFKEMISHLEILIYTYLKTFYYVVSKRYYYIGSTTQIVLDGLNKNEKAKDLFKSVVTPDKLVENIKKIINKNNYKNLNKIVILLFESFYKTEKDQLETIFPIKEIEFNDTDVELLLGEDYITQTLDTNIEALNKGIRNLIKNKNDIFLNETKNEKIKKFIRNMESFVSNLNTFIVYFCDNFEVFTKTMLLSFEEIFTGIEADPMIIPDYIDVKKHVKTAEAKKDSLDVKLINKKILTITIEGLRKQFDTSAIDNILLASFNIIFSVIPYIKLTDILAELKFSDKMLKKYFGHVASLRPSLKKVLEKITQAQEKYAESSRFRHQYMAQFDSEDEELDSLESDEEEVSRGKKPKFKTPEKVSYFDAQTLETVLERKLESLINKLTFVAVLVQYPRKTDLVEYSKELYEEWYKPILEEKGFKTITREKIYNLLRSTNMIFNYGKILGKTSILTISGKRDYSYLINFRNYMVKRARASSLQNVISDDLLNELGRYLGGASRMLRDFFEIGKVHVKEFIRNIEEIKAIKIGSTSWSSNIKRYSELLNKSLDVILRDVNDMTGQGILNTVTSKAEKEFASLEKNYIMIVNDVFFHSLIEKL